MPYYPRMRILSGGCGLFGDVFMALNGLRFAETVGLPCCVDWGIGSLYYEKPYGGNVWEYYFQEYSFGSERVLPVTLPYRPGAEDFNAYRNCSIRDSVHLALEKFARPRKDILNEVERFAKSNFSPEGVVGVHIRLTDAADGREQRKVAPLGCFIDEVNSQLERQPEANIFLASDDEHVISRFIDTYGERVVVQACTRSRDGMSIHGHYDRGVDASPYHKGREVMIDALLLARCSHLIRSHSRVTCFSLCVSPQLTYTDVDRKYLGVNRCGWLEEVF